MLKRLKKALFMISCVMIAFVLFGGVNVSAVDAELKDANKISIGDGGLENTYYFSNSPTSWSFNSKSSAFVEGDTILKYRVFNPSGKATNWSDEVAYVKEGDQFTIDFLSLVFSTDADYAKEASEYFASLTSVASDSTYYVQIKYYHVFRPFGVRLWTTDQNKDEIVKIVVNKSEVTPSLQVTYNSTSKKVDTVINFVEGDVEVKSGIVTNIRYFFTDEKVTISSKSDFETAYNSADGTARGNCNFTPSAKVLTSIDKPETEYKYVYVMAESGNGYAKVTSYDFASNTSSTVKPDAQDTNKDSSQSGIYDYKAGELILLVLVVVLIVSCSLIIVQKIVDYKKKLY